MLQIFSKTKCLLCSQAADEFNLGKFYVLEDFSVHYLCVLTGASLPQNGKSNEGVMGFLLRDILAAYETYCRKICVACKKSGASLECDTCKCRYHLPCGLKNDVLVQMFGRYASYCQNCSCNKLAMVSDNTSQSQCTICYSDITKGERIWSPACCRSDEIMHLDCLREYALNSGYLMKCPLCSNKQKFRLSLRKSGVYIPNTDATWLLEDEPNDTSTCALKCSAKVCKLVDDALNDTLVDCIICKDVAAHIECTFAGIFMCENCTYRLWPGSNTIPRFRYGKETLHKQYKWLPSIMENDEMILKFPWLENLTKSVVNGDPLKDTIMKIIAKIERHFTAQTNTYGTGGKVSIAKRHPAEEDLEEIKLEELKRGCINRPRVVLSPMNGKEDSETIIIKDIQAEENRQKLPVTVRIMQKLNMRWFRRKVNGKADSSRRMTAVQGMTKRKTCRKNKK